MKTLKYPELPVKEGDEIWFTWDCDIRSEIVKGLRVSFIIEDGKVIINDGWIITEESRSFHFPIRSGDKLYFKSKSALLNSSSYKNRY